MVVHTYGLNHSGGRNKRLMIQGPLQENCKTLYEKAKELGAWLKW
jgi:hypothetical protein